MAVIVFAQDRRGRWLSPGVGRFEGAAPVGAGWAAYDVSSEGFTVPRRAPDRRGEMMHARRIHWFAFEVSE